MISMHKYTKNIFISFRILIINTNKNSSKTGICLAGNIIVFKYYLN